MSERRIPHPDHPGRDTKGRVLPGFTCNPHGRPKKQRLDKSDPFIFGNTLIDIRMNGKTETMTRREALQNKLFENAMQGKVSAQRLLEKRFKEAEDIRAAAYSRLYEFLDRTEFDPDSVSDEDIVHMHQLMSMLELCSPADLLDERRLKARARKSRR